MVLKVQGLNKSFKGKQVLKDINFEVNEGEILALLGHSGAGKTTILRCINGLEQWDKGTIEIDGETLCKDNGDSAVYSSGEQRKSIRKKIGMVFQSYNLFPHMSVIQNIIEAPISVFRTPKEEAKNKAVELLKLMGLEGKINSYPFELSGGQKQRVAIARACALNPKLMCFDEPTSALDPELREGVARIIEDLAKNGMSVLIITHDMSFAKRVAKRIVFMEDGKILEEGSSEEIFTNPREESTRRFILGN